MGCRWCRGCGQDIFSWLRKRKRKIKRKCSREKKIKDSLDFWFPDNLFGFPLTPYPDGCRTIRSRCIHALLPSPSPLPSFLGPSVRPPIHPTMQPSVHAIMHQCNSSFVGRFGPSRCQPIKRHPQSYSCQTRERRWHSPTDSP